MKTNEAEAITKVFFEMASKRYTRKDVIALLEALRKECANINQYSIQATEDILAIDIEKFVKK